MILQALTRLYEDLAARGEVERPGWSPAKISHAICLNEDGALLQIIPVLVEEKVGNKTRMRPQAMNVPAAVKRAFGILPNFLWDNAAYILGLDGKENSGRTLGCFTACAALHKQLLGGLENPVARAIVKFFETWEPSKAYENTAVQELDLKNVMNLVFRVNGIYAHEDAAIKAVWQSHYDQDDGPLMQCLVTGKKAVAMRLHPNIKGVLGSDPMGTAMVSFKPPAFCSYGKTQSFNAPVSKYATFAYTTALNHLLADRDNVHRIGDTTVVCWAEGAEPSYRRFSAAAIFGGTLAHPITDHELRSVVKSLAQGLPCEELNLDPKRPFYILGVAPNAARLSVRFFYRDTFGKVMQHVNEHHERLEIIGSRYALMPLWAMLRETVNMNTTDKAPSPVMAGAVARAIFSGTAYPASLLEATTLRIRAEREITTGRAAILKAYYLKNPNAQCPKEVLTVSLNPSSTNIPYTLGRLFSVYEAVQESANPGINATIRDKYFNSAASTPATIFPILDNLCQKHLRKLEAGLRIHYERQIGQIKDILGETYPLRLTLPEQGSFNLGYYHQKQARYTKKEEQ